MTAPPHLQPNTRRWFADVTDEYDLEPHHQRLLQAAAEAWDRLQEAREVLRNDGTYLEGRYGKRAHPAVAVERDSRLAFARLIRELDLDGEPGPDPDRHGVDSDAAPPTPQQAPRPAHVEA